MAIKTLHFATPDEAQNRRLLLEARTVSKLRHANIVPVFEAGEEDGNPYLVFEYVEGGTLAQTIRGEGALPVRRAVELMTQVLDAVGDAHRFGTIHRDLKPSNILIDRDGMARVMDFGIASQVPSGGKDTTALMGTPAYMAPEYIAERIVGPQSDIFAAGLVLYEMVFGRRAISAVGVDPIMREIVDGVIDIPEQIGGEIVDSRLRDIIAKATAKDVHVRYGAVQQMRDVLADYLKPAEDADVVEEGDSASGTLEFLLRRMRHKSDFPALSEAVSSINRLAASDRENVNTLSNTILKDFALTNKILRLVNSAYYRTSGGGAISTVSRAIVVLGFDTIRNIAVSLILFEHLENKGHAGALKEEFLRANLGGMLAKDLAKALLRNTEEVFICAMFHNLGRLLTNYYFPEEAQEIQRQMQLANTSEGKASARVLGLTYEDLGIGVARSWGFPDTLVRSMRKMPSGAVRPPATREDRVHVVAAFSDEICRAVECNDPLQRAQQIEQVRSRFADSLAVSATQLQESLDRSIAETVDFSAILHIDLRQTRIGKQLLTDMQGGRRSGAHAGGTTLSDESLPGALQREEPATAAGDDYVEGAADAAAKAHNAQAILASGIQDISNSLVDDFSLNDVLRIVLETIYRALGFRRVLLCVRDARTNSMVGRLGFGPDADEVARHFRFSLGGMADVFNIVLGKGVDLLVHDAAEDKIASRIPDWYRNAVECPTFILLPLSIRGSAIALIYADKDKANEIVISEDELSLLRTLRNQAVLAIKQSR